MLILKKQDFQRGAFLLIPMYKHFEDMTGKVFGRLTFIKHIGSCLWLVRCSCGTEKMIQKANVVSGRTQSCGCLMREISSRINYKHGETVGRKRTPEYTAWRKMRYRCLDKNCKFYEDYGGRGIKICGRWITKSSFSNFLEDMKRKPSKDHSLERINNNAHYSCGHCDECVSNGWANNCRWASQKEQCNNRRSNRVLVVNGISKTLTQWSEVKGTALGTIWSRKERGWTDEQAVNSPVDNY